MLDAAGKLGKIVVGMNKALGDVPVTVKLRTGVKDGRNNAHKLMPRLSAEWGAAAMTVGSYSGFECAHVRLLNSTFLSKATWTHETATVLEACRLGLHQAMR